MIVIGLANQLSKAKKYTMDFCTLWRRRQWDWCRDGRWGRRVAGSPNYHGYALGRSANAANDGGTTTHPIESLTSI